MRIKSGKWWEEQARPALRRVRVELARLAAGADPRLEAALVGLVLAAVAAAAVTAASAVIPMLHRDVHLHRWLEGVRDAALLLVVALLAFNAVMYLAARLPFPLRRTPSGARDVDAWLRFFAGPAPAVSILIPCRDEDEAALTRALMSAALQGLPDRRVVLLIDAPGKGAAETRDPAALRALTRRLQNILQEPAGRFTQALADFRARQVHGALDGAMELRLLAELNLDAAEWFRSYARRHPGDDHVDSHFVEIVLERLCDEQLARAVHWQDMLADRAAAPDAGGIALEYRRLAALFAVEITSFERARYASLPAATGRIMSVNTYIALTGRNFHERMEGGQRYLEEGDYAGTYFHVPDAEYFLLLDADTYVAPDYLYRLLHDMQQPQHVRTAIIQAPVHPAPSTGVMLQRAAGALMEIRARLLRGYARHAAVSWTGESALIRKSALRAIARTRQEWGLRVTRYLSDAQSGAGQDTTLNLLRQGWRVACVPERLAWAPAPSGLGALAACHRRWDGGGLVTLSGLLAYLLRHGLRQPLASLLRVHQHVATVTTNLALLILFSVAVPAHFYGPWLAAAVLAYALLLVRDLRQVGYPWSDFLRVYALKLLLMPVILGGAVNTLHQAWTRSAASVPSVPAARDIDANVPYYYLAAYGLLLYWFVTAGIALTGSRWVHGLVVGVNAAFLLYAVVGYIGLRESLDNVQSALRRRRRSGGHPDYLVPAGADTEIDDAPPSTTHAVDVPEAAGEAELPVDPYVYHSIDSAPELERSRRVLVTGDKPQRH